MSHPNFRLHRFRTICALGAVALIHALSNVWFTARHTAGNPGDEVNHLEAALSRFHGGFAGLVDSVYPPFFYFVSSIAHHVLGTSKQASIAANLPFFLALLLGTWGITRKITRDRFAAFVAAFLVATYPMTAALSRMAMLDFALCGMVALAVWRLLESDGFAKKRVSAGFGVICGLGMLTRASFAVFLAGPVLWELFRGFRDRDRTGAEGKTAVTKNFLFATVIGLAVAAAWYVPDIGEKMRLGLMRVSLEPNHPDLSFFSLKGFLFYPFTILDLQISLWLAAFAAVALPGFIRSDHPYRGTSFLWLLVPWIFFSGLDWKLARYMTPVLPAVAVLTATGIAAVRTDRLRRGLWALLLLVAAVQWAALTFGVGPKNLFVENGGARFVLGFRLDPSAYREDIHVGPPNRAPSPLDNLENALREPAKKPGPIAIVRFFNKPGDGKEPGPPEGPLNLPLAYLIARDNLDARVFDCRFDRDGKVTSLWPGEDFVPERDIAGADVLIGIGKDFPKTLGQEGRWLLVKRFRDRGALREIYRRASEVNQEQ